MCGELLPALLLLLLVRERVSVQQGGACQCWGLVLRYVCLSTTGHELVLQGCISRQELEGLWGLFNFPPMSVPSCLSSILCWYSPKTFPLWQFIVCNECRRIREEVYASGELKIWGEFQFILSWASINFFILHSQPNFNGCTLYEGNWTSNTECHKCFLIVTKVSLMYTCPNFSSFCTVFRRRPQTFNTGFPLKPWCPAVKGFYFVLQALVCFGHFATKLLFLSIHVLWHCFPFYTVFMTHCRGKFQTWAAFTMTTE